MKKLLIISSLMVMYTSLCAQDQNTQLHTVVTKLDQAHTVQEYQQLEPEISRIAEEQKTAWLPYYYAALCNAKIGWLKQDSDPDNIERFADKAEQQIDKAQSLIDTATEKKALSEIYCVQMILNQARVFINPQTYGPKYGPVAFNYTQKAKQADPDNPRAIYLLGWQKFATPKMYGGDKALAKQLLTEAGQKLAAQSPDPLQPHWGKKEVDDLLKQIK
jgi:hypothetical protein